VHNFCRGTLFTPLSPHNGMQTNFRWSSLLITTV